MKSLVFAVALASVSLAGCVPYPIYKTLQPPAKATVLDRAGQPVPGAEVTLTANATPYGRQTSRVTRTTGSDGVARFAATREWRVESLMIHGSTEFTWNWCVRQPGCRTFHTAHSSSRGFERDLVVRLQPGASEPCPDLW